MKTNTLFKSIGFFAVVGVLALSSCDKNNDDLQPEESAEESAILVAEANISSDAVYIVNAVPDGCEKDTIAETELPASVNTYLEANYSGYTYLKTFEVEKDSVVQSYIVVIKFNEKPIGLQFDATGNFVKIFEQRERGQLHGRGWKQGGRFDGRDGKHRDTIALSSLSTIIRTYLAVTYPQDTLLAAHKGRHNEVIVITANNGFYANMFSASSIFVKRAQIMLNAGKKSAIAQADLSTKISSYLSATYPGYVFHRAYAVKLNSAVQAYIVLIDSNDTKYALHFDANGNLIKSVTLR